MKLQFNLNDFSRSKRNELVDIVKNKVKQQENIDIVVISSIDMDMTIDNLEVEIRDKTINIKL